MPLAPMNASQSRQLAVLLLVVFCVAVLAALAGPVWLLNRHYDAALEDLTSRNERFRRIAQTRPELVRQLDAIRAKETRRFFLRSGAPAFSAAELQEAMRAVVEGNGGRLIAMQPPAVRDESRYRQITVNVQLTANIFALRKILNAIDANVPYLFVDNLMVRTQVPSNFRPGPGAEPEMFVSLDVMGYAQTGT